MLLTSFFQQKLVNAEPAATEVIRPMQFLGQVRLPKNIVKKTLEAFIVPFIALLLFLGIWGGVAPKIHTSLGAVPGPTQVWQQMIGLVKEHNAEREKENAFDQRQAERNAIRLKEDPTADVTIRGYTGKPTLLDQIGTSLITVLSGFLVASLIAIPVGVLSGLSATLHRAINPFIQLFKPVSPLAWLPLVTMIVSAVYVSDDPLFPKSFLNSAITVALCCVWPTIISTSLGVSSIDKDLINVGRVMQLSWPTKITKIVLPASVPMIFAGLRLSLGIGWMVLIAAEMLAQNPGLGKFVWDEFQNGSSDSLARIMVAVFIIGIIGFLLDRIMLALQMKVSWDRTANLR